MDKGHLKDNQQIVRAAGEHMPAMTGLYLASRIDPQVFLDLAGSAEAQARARQFILSHGGFIKPPDQEEMRLGVHHGLSYVFLQDSKLLAYNLCVTDADKVRELLFDEFQFDRSMRKFDADSFEDWSGHKEINGYVAQRKIHWLDREQALSVFRAAVAGQLVWALEAATGYEYRKMGVSKALVAHLVAEQQTRWRGRAWHLFEIRKVNDVDLAIVNEASLSTYIRPETKKFAYTEEDITINSQVTLRVRWNHFIRHF